MTKFYALLSSLSVLVAGTFLYTSISSNQITSTDVALAPEMEAVTASGFSLKTLTALSKPWTPAFKKGM